MRIGIIGFGFMGQTHARAYLAHGKAELVAIADERSQAVTDRGLGNLTGGGASQLDVSKLAVVTDPHEILSRRDIDAVSICTPTPTHVDLALAAIEAGKHVLIEKPLALNSSDAHRVVLQAARHPDLVVMPAMCMRFWPEWTWLKQAIADGTFGRVLSATFSRLGAQPPWSRSFYGDPSQCGGAILDLHIHDVDFVRYCFGDPSELHSRAVIGSNGGVDHIVTMFDFAEGPTIVMAEGGWMATAGFPFTMKYMVQFERAVAIFDLPHDPPLTLFVDDDEPMNPDMSALPADGYIGEVAHFLQCIEKRSKPSIVTLNDAVRAIELIEQERASVESGQAIACAAK